MEKLKVIIADDEEAVRRGLANIINWNEMGFEVINIYDDGDGILHHIKENHVDVILSDIMMSRVSGLEVAKYVFESGLDITVVLISGYNEFELAKEAIKYKVNNYILKPANLDEIRKTMQSIRKERESLAIISQNKKYLEESTEKALNLILELLLEKKEGVAANKNSFDPTKVTSILLQNDLFASYKVISLYKIGFYSKNRFMQYTDTDIFDFLQKALQRSHLKGIYLPVLSGTMKIYIIAASNPQGSDECIHTKEFHDAFQEISSTMDIDIWIESERDLRRVISTINQTSIEHSEDNSTSDKKERERRVIALAKEYIVQHASRKITLDEVAQYVFLNPSYLSRLFKIETGVNFSSFLMMQKIEIAKQLLKNENLLIYQICERVGLKDVKYFYSMFKKYSGITPTEYRERN